MELIRTSREFDKKEIFRATHNNHDLLKDTPDGLEIHIDDFIVYKPDDSVDSETGEIKRKASNILIIYNGNTSYATSSPYAIRTLMEAIDFIGDDITVKLIKSQSKNGRTFMNFEIV